MAQIQESIVSKNEGIGVREAPICLLCHSEGVPLYQGLQDRLFNAPGTWGLKRCPNCGLVWLNPRPVFADIGKLYTEYFTHSDGNAAPRRSLLALRKAIKHGILAASFGYSDVAKHGAEKTVGRILSRIGPLREIAGGTVMWLEASQCGRLLDVGCGNGQFLANMRTLGWQVVGVEPDREAVIIARERFGLDVCPSTLEEANFPEESFDVITMNHVIEHVLDPIGTLRECHRVLKPGGRLVIVTPNTESLGHRLFSKAWVALDPPRHLYLFSPRTLRKCAKRAGLKVLKLWTTARSARWVWAASYLIRRNGLLPGGSPKKPSFWLWLEGLAFQAVEHSVCRVIDAGEEIVLTASK